LFFFTQTPARPREQQKAIIEQNFPNEEPKCSLWFEEGNGWKQNKTRLEDQLAKVDGVCAIAFNIPLNNSMFLINKYDIHFIPITGLYISFLV
jgi:hypothetical protein